MSGVEVRDLQVRYGRVTAVDGLSFTAEFGQVTVVLGPNGAGKTSTIECCEGFKTPTAGTVRVDGIDPVRDHAKLVQFIGVMVQDGAMPAGVRPLEVVQQFAAFYPNPLDPNDILERVGLSHRANTGWRRLSGGEQQRLSLALALVGRPRVLFLDEPTAGVDVEGRQLIRQVMREMTDEGACVVVTTHDLDDAERTADRIVIIDRGSIVADGTPTELLTSGGQQNVLFSANAGVATAPLTAAMGCAITEIRPGEYQVEVEGSPAAVAKLAAVLAEADIRIGDLRAGRRRLDDLFLQLTSERSDAERPQRSSDRRSRR